MTVARNEMPEVTKFQIEREQYLNFEVLCVSWSEKYDVLALATSTGDVCLYRLSWQKWWQATICEKTDEVICSLAYSLGSKLLAVGTTAGQLYLYTTESCACVHKIAIVKDKLNYLKWFNLYNMEDSSSLPYMNLFKNVRNDNKFVSELNIRHETLFPPLYSLDEENKELKVLSPTDAKIFEFRAILVVGAKNGIIKLLIGGKFLVVEVHRPSCSSSVELQHCHLSVADHTCTLYAAVKDTQGKLHILVFDVSFLRNYELQLRSITTHILSIDHLIRYVSCTLASMESLCKGIDETFSQHLSETLGTFLIDENYFVVLANYERQADCDTTVEHMFVQLFLSDTCSLCFENFLLDNVPEQLIKKTALTYERTCLKILGIGVRHARRSLEMLIYHVGEVAGLAKLPLIFQEIGITENMWGPCLQHTLLLAYKLEEFVLFLQQSRYNLGLFFNWLYLLLCKKQGNDDADPLLNANQGDDNSLASVLKHFLTVRERMNNHFAYPFVKYYFLDQPLPFNMHYFWRDLTADAKEVQSLIPYKEKYSLTQAEKKAKEYLEHSFMLIKKELSKKVKIKYKTEVNYMLQSRNPSSDLTAEGVSVVREDHTWYVTRFCDAEHGCCLQLLLIPFNGGSYRRFIVPLRSIHSEAVSIEDIKEYRNELALLWTEKLQQTNLDTYISHLTLFSLEKISILPELIFKAIKTEKYFLINSELFTSLITGACKLNAGGPHMNRYTFLSFSFQRRFASLLSVKRNKICLVDLSEDSQLTT